MVVEVKVKLVEGGKLPQKSTEGAAAFDCYVRDMEWLEGRKKMRYYLGFKMEIPQGYVAKIFPRSSIYKTGLRLTNDVGLIDPDYRGEVMAIFDYQGTGKIYALGERCCQMTIEKLPKVNLKVVDKLSETKRGEGGFGSTGNK